jgi:hypothetical protein
VKALGALGLHALPRSITISLCKFVFFLLLLSFFFGINDIERRIECNCVVEITLDPTAAQTESTLDGLLLIVNFIFSAFILTDLVCYSQLYQT